jgi:hypothetical protein
MLYDFTDAEAFSPDHNPSFTIFLNLPVNRGKHCRPVIPYSKVIGVVRCA